MKFDTVIIGGGLSGLTCGISLAKAGQRCAIVSSGQSALHFSSGSFDLLNFLRDGTEVTNPLESVGKLIYDIPNHPYSKLGIDKFKDLSFAVENFFKEIHLPLQGSAEKNHYRITPMGTLKPTWLTIPEYAASEAPNRLPWKKVTIFNPVGFLDFYPRFIADEFLKYGTESDIRLFTLPDLDYLRRNPSEMRSTNISRVLEKEENIEKLVEILKTGSEESEAIIFPACLGLKDATMVNQLEAKVGKPIYLLPTLPPSIIGIRTQQYLYNYFMECGGIYMLGDTIEKAEIQDNKITKVYSYNHQDIPFTAENYVLATGSYFSQGLIASRERIYEPVFNLDVSFDTDRNQWYNTDIFGNQPYQEYGVKTDTSFRGLFNGKAIENLYVSGAILEGFNPVKEGSGAGVSLLTAMYIAEKILSK